MIALSYRWLTGLHPDPTGTTLAAIRRYLDAHRVQTAGCGLFWDYASLPQKGINGEERTADEKAVSTRGLQ